MWSTILSSLRITPRLMCVITGWPTFMTIKQDCFSHKHGWKNVKETGETVVTDVRCGTCRHYVPERNPDTGRSLPSRNGECAFEVVVTSPLPYGVSVQVYRTAVWSYSGVGCPCHDPKKKRQ